MEKMAKEFTDIDEGVTNDVDLMASLKARMSNKTDTGGSDETPDAPPTMGGGDGDGSGGGSDSPPADSGGGAALLERPSGESPSPSDSPPEPPEPPAPPAMGSAADIERLNKMFGSPDADK